MRPKFQTSFQSWKHWPRFFNPLLPVLLLWQINSTTSLGVKWAYLKILQFIRTTPAQSGFEGSVHRGRWLELVVSSLFASITIKSIQLDLLTESGCWCAELFVYPGEQKISMKLPMATDGDVMFIGGLDWHRLDHFPVCSSYQISSTASHQMCDHSTHLISYLAYKHTVCLPLLSLSVKS